MNILVYGAGVIGSVYAARLQEAGYHVTLLARDQHAVSLRTQGILLEDASTGQRTTTRVSVIDHLAPMDSYDVVLVTVRMDQLASILPTLAANHQIPIVLFMLNNPDGIQRLDILEPQRVILGFPSVGGTRQGEGIRYILIRQQQTTLGEVDGQITPRLQQLARAFKKAGFSVALSPNMPSWLKTHAIFVSCVSAALAITEGDSVRLGHTRKNVVMMVKAIREGFKALQVQGTRISPFNLKVIFLWMPMWFAVLYWQYAFRTTIGTLAMAPHANAARDEMRQVAQDILAQLQTSSVSTPTLNHLLTFLNSPARSIKTSPSDEAFRPLLPFWRRLALVSLKAVHSLLYFSIEFCMGYLIYAGLKGKEDRRTAIAASIVAGESLIFLGNRCRCPLTGLAHNLGDARGSVTDIYLPDVLASNLPLIHVPLLVLALFLHVRNFIRRSRA